MVLYEKPDTIMDEVRSLASVRKDSAASSLVDDRRAAASRD
jgi:hypothetical protein